MLVSPHAEGKMGGVYTGPWERVAAWARGNGGKHRRARRGGEDGQAAEGGALRSPSVPCPQAGDCTATPEATVSKSRGGRRVLTGAAAGLVGALAENLAGQFRHEGATAAHAPHRENPHTGRFLLYQRLEWMGDHTHAVTTTRGPRGNHVYAAQCMWRKRQQEEQSPQGAEPPGSLLGPARARARALQRGRRDPPRATRRRGPAAPELAQRKPASASTSVAKGTRKQFPVMSCML